MKHSPLTLLSIVALLITALAPSAFAQGLILRGGMNWANAVTDPEPASSSNREYRDGWNAGLLGEFGEGFSRVMIGAGYEQKGMHLNGAGGGDIRLDYMTIPVMLSFGSEFSNSGPSPRLFVNLGIEPGFLLSSDYAGNGFTYTFDTAEDFDFALRGEFGIEIPIGYGPAGILGVGYTYSLTDANSGRDEWNNYVIHAFLGLKISTI